MQLLFYKNNFVSLLKTIYRISTNINQYIKRLFKMKVTCIMKEFKEYPHTTPLPFTNLINNPYKFFFQTSHLFNFISHTAHFRF